MLFVSLAWSAGLNEQRKMSNIAKVLKYEGVAYVENIFDSIVNFLCSFSPVIQVQTTNIIR